MSYWRWWVYAVIGVCFALMAAFARSEGWRLIFALLCFWYGMSTGAQLVKRNVARKIILAELARKIGGGI